MDFDPTRRLGVKIGTRCAKDDQLRMSAQVRDWERTSSAAVHWWIGSTPAQSYAQLLNHGLARPIEGRILALPSGKFDMVVRNAAEMRGPQGAEQTASEHVAQPAKISVRVLFCV